MVDLLGWVAAAGGITATAGAWRSEATARWQALVERWRNDSARRENDLHRARYSEVWNWQRSQPQGEQRADAARWYGEWTGNFAPRRGGLDDAPLTPGLHSGSEDEAYRNYLDFLEAQYHPGRLGPPREALRMDPPAEVESAPRRGRAAMVTRRLRRIGLAATGRRA